MFITYLVIRALTLPLAFLPYKVIHLIGVPIGSLAYYCIPKFRKRALSNLALATDLKLTNLQVRRIAKKSIQNLMITCLEYPKLAREKDISKIAHCENPETAQRILKEKKGLILFCGHQSNWEILFLDASSRMPAVAIGRPIKNKYLYQWVKSIRENFGGKIIAPKEAIKEGIRALRGGYFLGIVGDQGMPDSGYSSSFLGRLAWTSPIPALLAYKTDIPIIVVTTKRENGRYLIRYSAPIYPNPTAPKDQEIKRLMDSTLEVFQETIRATPDQWLWVHNRWKQQTLHLIKKPYRCDSIALFLNDQAQVQKLSSLRSLYPLEHIAIFVPAEFASQIEIEAEIYPYHHLKETCKDDLRFKLIVNFTQNLSINKHYKKRSAVTIVSPKTWEEFDIMVRNA